MDACCVEKALHCVHRSVAVVSKSSPKMKPSREVSSYPKITVVPLSVTIIASLSTTFPPAAISPYNCHSSSPYSSTSNGATLNGPANRSCATSPKYWTPVSSVLNASPKRQQSRLPWEQRCWNQDVAFSELASSPAKPTRPSFGKEGGERGEATTPSGC